ncbi:hypothetical protein QAD02_010050 [Eretmocerus hayati]|uniref:Uncharacterized protein n=1 Tax=Eretmocerus hayati TaxID=131215 RepID=A0ACC2NB29_9HYME|nr:hypothetical protein QAD02_010050 [Eretmocerus hayati]
MPYFYLVNRLKEMMPNDGNKVEVFELMEEIRFNRHLELKSSESSEPGSLATFFNRYPEFKDYDGRLIDVEYSKMNPDSSNFERVFSEYAGEIMNHCQNKKSVDGRRASKAPEGNDQFSYPYHPVKRLYLYFLVKEHSNAIVLLSEILPDLQAKREKE